MNNTFQIFIGNIHYNATQDELHIELKRLLGSCVVAVRLPIDSNTQRGRGFAFTTIENADMQAVIDDVNGHMFQGRALRANEAARQLPSRAAQPKPKASRPDHPAPNKRNRHRENSEYEW